MNSFQPLFTAVDGQGWRCVCAVANLISDPPVSLRWTWEGLEIMGKNGGRRTTPMFSSYIQHRIVFNCCSQQSMGRAGGVCVCAIHQTVFPRWTWEGLRSWFKSGGHRATPMFSSFIQHRIVSNCCSRQSTGRANLISDPPNSFSEVDMGGVWGHGQHQCFPLTFSTE